MYEIKMKVRGEFKIMQKKESLKKCNHEKWATDNTMIEKKIIFVQAWLDAFVKLIVV